MNNQKAHNAIGIFDSGIGGLTVANAIKKALPNEQLIYFGDTAHLPYGDKSAESIKHYSLRIAEFLQSQHCKMLVIACNSASAVGFNAVRLHYGSKMHVINVIDPVVKHVAAHYTKTRVGVIGTKATINSRVYAQRIQRKNKNLKVTSLATPLLAPMVEEGFFNNNISQTIINAYLSKKSFQGIEAIILGCTHYPLIKKQVANYYGQKVQILDSAEIVAKAVKEKLTRSGLLNPAKLRANHKFFVSEYTDAFEQSTRIFFRDKIQLKEKRLWG